MELKKCELLQIQGGAININGTWINAVVRGIEAIMDLGRSLGTAIRRIGSNSVCNL